MRQFKSVQQKRAEVTPCEYRMMIAQCNYACVSDLIAEPLPTWPGAAVGSSVRTGYRLLEGTTVLLGRH